MEGSENVKIEELISVVREQYPKDLRKGNHMSLNIANAITSAIIDAMMVVYNGMKKGEIE